jgi:nucleotide-binding universal stress UspA family protein
MKSVLVHINRDEGQEARFQAALDVTRAFAGHLTCLQVSPLEAYLTADPYGIAFMLEQTLQEVRKEEDIEREGIESRLRAEGANWDWHTHTGAPARLLAEVGAMADIIVVSSPGGEWPARLEVPPTAADVLMRSHTPVLAVPDSVRGMNCGGVAVVAWNGSPEACQAVRASMPLLRQAAQVLLVHVDEGGGYDLPPTEAAAYLSRHGIRSEIVPLKRGGRPVADVILAEAGTRGAAYVVMGAYGHSRLRERLLGGVTREMLEKARLPLLLVH